jgi:hypothetical protein
MMAAMASEPASRARQFRDALYEALSGAPPAIGHSSPLSSLLTFVERTMDANLKGAVPEFRRLVETEVVQMGRLHRPEEDAGR